MAARPAKASPLVAGRGTDAFRESSQSIHVAQILLKLCDSSPRGPLPHGLYGGSRCSQRIVACDGSDRRHLRKQNRVMTLCHVCRVYLPHVAIIRALALLFSCTGLIYGVLTNFQRCRRRKTFLMLEDIITATAHTLQQKLCTATGGSRAFSTYGKTRLSQ